LVIEDKKTVSAVRTTDKQTDIFGLRINKKHVTILMFMDTTFSINHSGCIPECAHTFGSLCQEISVVSLVTDAGKNCLIFQLYTAF